MLFAILISPVSMPEHTLVRVRGIDLEFFTVLLTIYEHTYRSTWIHVFEAPEGKRFHISRRI